jgi:hypothetical protein
LLLGFVVVVAFILLPSVRILAPVALVVALVVAVVVAVVVVPVALVVSVMLVVLVLSAVLVALIVLCVCVLFDIPHREGGKNFILGCTGRAKKFFRTRKCGKIVFYH